MPICLVNLLPVGCLPLVLVLFHDVCLASLVDGRECFCRRYGKAVCCELLDLCLRHLVHVLAEMFNALHADLARYDLVICTRCDALRWPQLSRYQHQLIGPFKQMLERLLELIARLKDLPPTENVQPEACTRQCDGHTTDVSQESDTRCSGQGQNDI